MRSLGRLVPSPPPENELVCHHRAVAFFLFSTCTNLSACCHELKLHEPFAGVMPLGFPDSQNRELTGAFFIRNRRSSGVLFSKEKMSREACVAVFVSCSSAVIKYTPKSIFKEEKVYLAIIPGSSPLSWGRQDRNLKQLIMSTIKS